MGSVQIVLLLICALAFVMVQIEAVPLPDSAGIVEMPPGSAYGGIPYGSVTGMVANYFNGGRSLGPHGQQPLRPVYY